MLQLKLLEEAEPVDDAESQRQQGQESDSDSLASDDAVAGRESSSGKFESGRIILQQLVNHFFTSYISYRL